MYGTRVETISGDKWTSENHDTYTVRYFNGRKYYFVTAHNFMTSTNFQGGKRGFWLNRTQYVAVKPPNSFVSIRFSFSQRGQIMRGPSVLARTIAGLVPDDIQAVPF